MFILITISFINYYCFCSKMILKELNLIVKEIKSIRKKSINKCLTNGTLHILILLQQIVHILLCMN